MHPRTHPRPNAARFRLFAALLSLLVAGCSTQAQRIGADDGTDMCRPQRVALDSTGEFFASDIIQGAAVGAVGGGLVGLLAGGNARSALIGAAAGAAVGGVGGYWKARMQQQRDQASLFMTVSADIRRDNEYIDKAQLAFNQLVDCRQMEANRIKTAYRYGQLTRPQADAMMLDVRRRADGDVQIARATSQRIQGRSADFEFANAQINPGRPAQPAYDTGYGYGSYPAPRVASRAGRGVAAPAAPPPAPAGTPADVQAVTSTNLAKRDQFNRSIAAAQSRQTAFEVG